MAENTAKVTLEIDQSGLGAQLREAVGAITKAGRSLGDAFLAGGGLQAGLRLFDQYTALVNESVDATLRLNAAMRSWDQGQLTSGLATVNKELDRMVELAALAKPGQFGLGKIAADFMLAKQGAQEFLTGTRPEDTQKALESRARVLADIAENRKQTALLVKDAERDLQELNIKQQAAVRRGNLDAAQEIQRQIKERSDAEDELARKQLRTRQEQERAEAIASGVGVTGAMRERQRMEAADSEQERANRRARQAEKFAEQERRLQAEFADVETARQRLAAARDEQEAQFAANAVKREEDRKVAALKAAESIMDAERSLAKARADAQGVILDDVQRTADERRRITDETAAAEIRSVEAETGGILKALGARRAQAQRELGGLGALEGVLSAPELQRRRDALKADIASREREINEAAAAGASQRAAIEERAAAERRRIFIREQQERLAIAQEGLRQEVAVRQSVTGTLATLGLRTSAQAIAEQFGLARATTGRAQQAAAFQQGAQLLAQRQQESRGAAGGILGAVMERLGGEGSLQDVAQAFADIRQESKQTLADFRGGGAVDLGALQSSLGLLPLMEQADKLGGVGAIFGQAATPLAKQFEAAGGGPFDTLAKSAETPLGDLEANFRSTFDRITATIDAAAAEWSTTISRAAVDMAKVIEDQLVRNLDLAKAKR